MTPHVIDLNGCMLAAFPLWAQTAQSIPSRHRRLSSLPVSTSFKRSIRLCRTRLSTSFYNFSLTSSMVSIPKRSLLSTLVQQSWKRGETMRRHSCFSARKADKISPHRFAARIDTMLIETELMKDACRAEIPTGPR